MMEIIGLDLVAINPLDNTEVKNYKVCFFGGYAYGVINENDTKRQLLQLHDRKLQAENQQLRRALDNLVQLHMCEQEGIQSGQPTAVEQACDLIKNEKTKNEKK